MSLRNAKKWTLHIVASIDFWQSCFDILQSCVCACDRKRFISFSFNNSSFVIYQINMLYAHAYANHTWKGPHFYTHRFLEMFRSFEISMILCWFIHIGFFFQRMIGDESTLATCFHRWHWIWALLHELRWANIFCFWKGKLKYFKMKQLSKDFQSNRCPIDFFRTDVKRKWWK